MESVKLCLEYQFIDFYRVIKTVPKINLLTLFKLLALFRLKPSLPKIFGGPLYFLIAMNSLYTFGKPLGFTVKICKNNLKIRKISNIYRNIKLLSKKSAETKTAQSMINYSFLKGIHIFCVNSPVYFVLRRCQEVKDIQF